MEGSMQFFAHLIKTAKLHISTISICNYREKHSAWKIIQYLKSKSLNLPNL